MMPVETTGRRLSPSMAAVGYFSRKVGVARRNEHEIHKTLPLRNKLNMPDYTSHPIQQLSGRVQSSSGRKTPLDSPKGKTLP